LSNRKTRPPKRKIAAGIGGPHWAAHAVDKAAKAMMREGVPLDSREAGERVRAVVQEIKQARKQASERRRTRAEGAAEIRGQALRLLETGAKMHHRKNKGGQPSQDVRDRAMAREFKRRVLVSRDCTDDATKATDASHMEIARQIGRGRGLHGRDLKRSTAHRAIKRGLKLLAEDYK
jgi:hypothetical protein